MNNPVLKIAVCNRRTDRKYKNVEQSWTAVKDRNRVPVRTTETVKEYPQLSKEHRDALKDQGGFVGGWLREGIRRNGNVISRCIGALDADNIPEGVNFPAVVRSALAGVEWFLYSTHKHTPEAPRFRLVILFDREVTEDEYPALMRQVAHDIGMDYFDDTTYQANRMMYWASCPSDGVFVFDESLGGALHVDGYMGRFDDWRDSAQWPTSKRQSEVIQKTIASQEDPLNKEGLVGAFCRTFFPVQTAMEAFLPDVYAPTGVDNRWDYLPADSTAGVVIYDDRFVYSHHATDPAGGKLLNAFDLVRIHKFGNDETKKSFQQMCDFAIAQEAVKKLLDQERVKEAQADFGGYESGDWTKQLRYKPKSKELENSTRNLMLILNNDPLLQPIAYNGLAGQVQVLGDLPWERDKSNLFWRQADDSQLIVYLDQRYGVFTKRNLEAAFGKVVDDRSFHPIREYLESLPEWDGIERIDRLLCRCLEADDTPYVHAVTRKFFAAAVARVLRPGTKFDNVLVLDGAQGIGKSTLFRELVGDDYYSETLSLTDMNDKGAAEKLLGNWVVEIGELAGMRKADIEKVKAFISTKDDKYRPPFGHVVESHPRQTVILATVNGERGYLRDITGNRRFWIVKCRQEEAVKRFAFTPEERDQIWAEAIHIWKEGEKLYLEGNLLKDAEEVQRGAMEVDERLGMVETYLNTLLPENWGKMTLFERRNWLQDPDDPTRPKGVVMRTEVSNPEIWSECFGRNPSEMKPSDSYSISALMVQVDGWERSKKLCTIPIYGRQRVYRKMGEIPDFLD